MNKIKTIEEVLAAVYLAGTENGLGWRLSDPKEIMHRKEAFIKSNPVCKEALAVIGEIMDYAGDRTRAKVIKMGLLSWEMDALLQVVGDYEQNLKQVLTKEIKDEQERST